jgi:protein O-mannosyl-transferase
VTFFAQGEAVAPIDLVPLSSRIANAVVSYGAYIGDFVWPMGLAAFYPHPGSGLPIGKVVVSALVLVGGTVAALVWRRHFPDLFVGWFWYVGMFIPVIGLVQVGSQAVADRYTYLPQIGLCVAVSWGVKRLVASWRHRRWVCGGAAALALLALTGVSWRQASYWRNSETLWTHTLAHTVRNFVAHSNLGDALAESGQADKAITQYQRALDIRPSSAQVNYNLGNSLAKIGQMESAIAHYQKALGLMPDHAKAHNNLGIALQGRGQIDAAIAHYQRALEIKPDFADAHYNLGAALAGKGLVEPAIAQYRKALEIRPDHAKAHNNLGIALEGSGQVDAAIVHYRKALEIKPDFAEAHNNLGIALEGSGQVDAAIIHYRKALEIRPDYIDAHYNLGIVLANQGQLEAAIPHFKRVLELNPNNTEARKNLDLILQQQGRHDQDRNG